jgi:hypothetical protein
VRPGVVLCAVIGHRWHVDESSTEPDPVICCDRCGRRQLAQTTSAFNRRIAAKTGNDRAVGPF